MYNISKTVENYSFLKYIYFTMALRSNAIIFIFISPEPQCSVFTRNTLKVQRLKPPIITGFDILFNEDRHIQKYSYKSRCYKSTVHNAISIEETVQQMDDSALLATAGVSVAENGYLKLHLLL